MLLITAVCSVHSQEIFKEERGLYSTRAITAKASAESGNTVTIKSAANLEGAISVVTDVADTVALTYYKKARTDSRSQAIDYIDLIGVSLSRSPQGVELQLRAPNPAPWEEQMESGLVDVRLTLPQESFIEVDARLFDFEATGPFSGVTIPSSLGRIDIADVDGVLELSTANQRVTLEDITGKISVVTSNARIEGVNLTSRGEPASIRNDGGDIQLEDFTGAISVRNNFGRISIIGYVPRGTSNYIRGMSEPILLEIDELDETRVIVSNRYEDIELVIPREISAVLSLAVEEGNTIEASNLLVKPDLVEENRLYLISGEGTSTLSGSIQGRGNIYVQGRE